MADIIFNLPNFAADGIFYRNFEKELEGVLYSFTVQYFERSGTWTISIGTDEKTQGIRIFAGLDILKPFHYRKVPPGELKTLDKDGLNRDPTRETFGDRITLVYTEAS